MKKEEKALLIKEKTGLQQKKVMLMKERNLVAHRRSILRRELKKRISQADVVQYKIRVARQEKARKELNGRREKAVKGQVKGGRMG